MSGLEASGMHTHTGWNDQRPIDTTRVLTLRFGPAPSWWPYTRHRSAAARRLSIRTGCQLRTRLTQRVP